MIVIGIDLARPGSEITLLRALVPVKTVSVLNRREHWAGRARRTKIHRREAAWALRIAGFEKPSGKVSVTLTRIAGPRGKELDDDNLRGALKAVRDGVSDWLGIDDADPSVKWDYLQIKGKAWAVQVEVAW
jgi:hypothetical protein